MSKTFDQGKDQIEKVCQYFAKNREAFLAPGVKEAHVRQTLIDPFFEALDWDVRNTSMNAPQYREVIPEDSLDVEGHQKAPDYTFRVGPLPKFYAEAKKCGININSDPGPAYQLRRYGWSAKVPLSILTDFEELSVYECALRPYPSDKASHARIQYFSYEEYPDRWHELWDVFSHEAVWSGAFDQYAASKRKRGTSEVDAEFLKEIEGWRDALARNIAVRNKDISHDDLNAAVQITIDRIIFLRMAEDRGTEPYEQLLKLCDRDGIYSRFIRDLCHRADQKYNSGLFHFQKESGVSENPDHVTPKLAVDDNVFKHILQSLYFEHGSPYHFGVLPVEILGTVYERFLGKVIRLTAGHQAKIEEKPEVRKAGGVYYTPAYIVDYIVNQTVVRQIEGRSPAQLAGGKGKAAFRVLDMACGSGSFLLGAFQALLNHCLKWYTTRKPEEFKKAVYLDSRKGEWRLMINEKKRILVTHIFGVDVDPQAVEVSKLSLMLKVLESENSETVGKQLQLFEDRALPNLSYNIKSGNSLISPDYFMGALLLDSAEINRVNAFDWKGGFPNAIDAGGFDCILGNPPYVFARDEGFSSREKEYFGKHYLHQNYQLNTYALFMERAYKLLAKGGFLGFIIPNNWLTIDTFTPLRRFVLESTKGVKVVNILDRVFDAANVDTAIILFEKGKPTNLTVAEIRNKTETFARQVELSAISSPSYIIQISLIRDFKAQTIMNRIKSCAQPLSTFCTVSTGLKVYQTGKGKPPQKNYEKENRVFHSTIKQNKTFGKYLDGVDVRRYHLVWSGEYLSYGDWLAEPRKSVPFSGERILVRQIPARPPYLVHGVYVDEAYYNDINSMIIFAPVGNTSLKYLLGLINSRLLSFWFQKTFDKLQRKIFPQFKVKELAEFPIRPINFSNAADAARHDRIVKLVEQIHKLNMQQDGTNSYANREIHQHQINATDAEIDRMVYELYGLTAEEIAIVEGK